VRPARVEGAASGRVYPPAAIGSAPPGPAGAGPEPVHLRRPGCGGVSPAGRPARAIGLAGQVLPLHQARELGQHPGPSRHGGGRGGDRPAAVSVFLLAGSHTAQAQTTGRAATAARATQPGAGLRSSGPVAGLPTATVPAAASVRPSPAISPALAVPSYPVQSQPSPQVPVAPSASTPATPSKSPSAKPSKSASSSATSSASSSPSPTA
jgi:hypothetical protein